MFQAAIHATPLLYNAALMLSLLPILTRCLPKVLLLGGQLAMQLQCNHTEQETKKMKWTMFSNNVFSCFRPRSPTNFQPSISIRFTRE
uniref:Putative secreted protein n=1 Tax=Amblyomma cajennense TaxID=34607 RepID=A0A023FBR5_AMBCJ